MPARWCAGRHCSLSPQDTSVTCRELHLPPLHLIPHGHSRTAPLWAVHLRGCAPARPQTKPGSAHPSPSKEAEAEALSPLMTAQHCSTVPPGPRAASLGPEGGQCPAAVPGWRSRVSRAALRDTSSCCRWSVLSRQYFRSSTAGRESGKSAGRGQASHKHMHTRGCMHMGAGPGG